MFWRSILPVLCLVCSSLRCTNANPYCPAQWTPYMNSCYQLRGQTSFTAKIWVAARSDCRRNTPMATGYLASIHSQQEQNFVQTMIQGTVNISNVQSVFLGLSSRRSSGGYGWSDGTAVSYTHWKSGFVTEQGKQCIAIGTSNGYWNDRNCDDRAAYVCKMRMINSTVSPTRAPPTKASVYCPSGWDQYADRCYWYSNSNRATYDTAISYCQARGGDLVSINSVYEQAYVLAKLRGKGNVWLGLNDISREGEYVWTDGSDVSFTDWGFGEPNSHADHEDCVELTASTGLWNDRVCSGTLSYMCEKAATQIYPPASTATNCPTGWLSYNGHCYFFNAHANLNNTMAQSYCVSQNSHLAHINDIYENAWIASQYPLVGGMPIRNNRSTHFWIGLNDLKTEGLYTWTDGYPVEITSWRKGEPNDYNHGEDCVEFFLLPSSRLINGVWNDLFCNQKLGVLCERRQTNARPTTAPQPTTAAPGNCPNGLLLFNNYCYMFKSLLRLSWTQAVQRCRQYGADLISIHSTAEQNFVMKHAISSGFSRSLWIGLGDRNVEGGYVWSDGSPVQYTNWNNNEPNNYYGQEDCVEAYLSRNNKNWNDQTCEQLRYFGCKIKLGKTLIMPTATAPSYIGYPCSASSNTYSHGPYCYTIVKDPKIWSAASQDCKANYNGHLVSITSLDEEEFLANTVKTINDTSLTTHAWIGLNDQGKEGTFEWSDGSPINFIYWYQGEPNNVQSEDCVELVKGLYWNDIACSETYSYICKSVRSGVTVSPPNYNNVTIWGYCPDGWQTFGSYCYQLNKAAMTWPDAEKTCVTSGGHLTSILTTAESTFIQRHVMNSVQNAWIGLNDRENEHTFVWTDGSPVMIVSWWRNQPNDYDGQQNCVYMNRAQGRWNDITCGRKYSFVCKMPKIHYPSTAPPSVPPAYTATCVSTYDQCVRANKGCQRVTCPSYCQTGDVYGWQIYSSDSSICRAATQAGLLMKNSSSTVIDVLPLEGRDFYSSAIENGVFSMSHGLSDMSFSFKLQSGGMCDPGWISNGHACYLFVASSNTASRSWSQAQKTCRSLGAYVTVVDSAQEQAFVQSQLPPAAGQVWIGLIDKYRRGSFVWTDGTPLQFNVWGDGQPVYSSQSKQNCVLMNPNGGQKAGTWITADCSSVAGYICEKFVETGVPTTITIIQGGCPDGWVLLDDTCYWATRPDCVGDCFLPWSNARAACMAMVPGADLTSVNTYNELIQAQYVLPRLGWGDVWIGLNDIKTEGAYVWSDGSPVGERGLDWAPGEPNDKNKTQNCVAMLSDGTITDQDCSIPYPFACEIPLSASPHHQKSSGGLSSGGIAGLVIGMLATVIIVVIVTIIMRKRRGATSVGRYTTMEHDGDDHDEGLLGRSDATDDDDEELVKA